MKKILVVSLTALFLVACAATQQTPPPPTATPVPPTPTNTPTPTPIPPTPTPTMISMEDLIEELDAEVIYQLMDLERTEYLLGYYRFAIGIATELIDTWLGDYPDIYDLRAESYAALGDFESAVKDMEEALQRVPSKSDEDWARVNNNLCWYLSVAGNPDEALPYCEQAVSMDPIAMYLDSRGVAYAMLGRTDEAVADFQKVIEEFEGSTDLPVVEIRESREKWVADLMAGVDFTGPEFLEELQAEEIDPDAFPEPDLLQPEDYTRGNFSQFLASDGFHNEGILELDTNSDAELHSFMYEDGCTIIIWLVETEKELIGIHMDLLNCSEDHLKNEIMWFMAMLFYKNNHTGVDSIEMGQGAAWWEKDVKDVVDGKIEETKPNVISGLEFSAETVEYEELGSGITILTFMP